MFGQLNRKLAVGISFATQTAKIQPEGLTVWDTQTENYEIMAEIRTTKLNEGDLLAGQSAVVMVKIIAATREATT